MSERHYNLIDNILIELDKGVRTLFGRPEVSERENPADKVHEADLSHQEQKHTAGLMRVNHAGEVCAQALYQGQALTAKLPEIRDQMQHAATEENDHLAWCQARINELGSHTSYLDPLWYVGSFAIGATAGAIGDKWSLGFVAETERQVVAHLSSHMNKLPQKDKKTAAILQQMKIDEDQHAQTAVDAGAATLPLPIKQLMGLVSKIMTKTAYWI